MHCLPSLLNIMFPCLMEVPITDKMFTEVFKISTDVNFMTTYIKIEMLILSSTTDLTVSLIKII